MGVNFSYCNAHWTYNLFHEFRVKLAHEVGIDLNQMEGFGGDRSFSNYKDAIIPLLEHSDCEGELTVEDCARIAPRLRQLVCSWNGDPDQIQARMLAEGMEHAANLNRPFYFC